MKELKGLSFVILISLVLSCWASSSLKVQNQLRKLHDNIFLQKDSTSPLENDEMTSEDAIEFDIGEILDKEEVYLDVSLFNNQSQGFMSFRCKEGLKTQTIEEQDKYPLLINDIKKNFQGQVDPGVWSFFDETGQGHADDTCIASMTDLLDQFYDEYSQGDFYIDETVKLCLELAVLDFIGKGAEEMCDFIIHDIFYILGMQENLTAENACDLLYMWGYAYWGANAVDVSLTYDEEVDTESLLLIQKAEISLEKTSGYYKRKFKGKTINRARRTILTETAKPDDVLKSFKLLN